MPQETGPYELRRCLGVGGQGQVWRAEGPGGTVALKLAQSPKERQHLQAEGALLAGLQHPAVVRYLGHEPGGQWLATALVSGQPIDRWAAGRPLSARMAVLARITEGLAYLHALGVRHGDLKPNNVLVDDSGAPVLIDLSPHSGGGSLGFAAPEQLLGTPLGPAADVYALGCLAYQLMTNQAPFSATDRNALMWLPVNALPLPPSSLMPGIPQRLEAAVMSCLARTPEQRPTDLKALAVTLEAGLSSPTARPVLGMVRVRRLLRRRLVEAMEGSSPIMTVLGAPRSGRETLIEEVLQAAAREGMVVLRPPSQAAAAAVLSQLSGRPFALRLEASAPHTAALCTAIQSRQPAGITLVRAEAPLPGLPPGGWVRPTKLNESDIAKMLEIANQSPGLAPDVLRITRGHPGIAEDYILRRAIPSDLSPQQRVLLSAVTTGPRSLSVLALRMALGEHDLLDIAAPLLERGLLEERDGGRALVALLPRPARR